MHWTSALHCFCRASICFDSVGGLSPTQSLVLHTPIVWTFPPSLLEFPPALAPACSRGHPSSNPGPVPGLRPVLWHEVTQELVRVWFLLSSLSTSSPSFHHSSDQVCPTCLVLTWPSSLPPPALRLSSPPAAPRADRHCALLPLPPGGQGARPMLSLLPPSLPAAWCRFNDTPSSPAAPRAACFSSSLYPNACCPQGFPLKVPL